MTYEVLPSKSYVKNLKRKGCEFTTTVLKEAMVRELHKLGVADGMVTVVAEEVPANRPDKDPQTLFIRYNSEIDKHPYLADEVKMEFGVRSLKEPNSVVGIKSLLSEAFPLKEEAFDVTVVDANKTLLEKMFLLHEKFSQGRIVSFTGSRQSRHLYDIASMIATESGSKVLDDEILFQQILQHRKYYVDLSGIDYDGLQQRGLRFVPPVGFLDDFQKDYEEMQRSMIYGTSPGFSDMIFSLKYFNAQFILAGFGLTMKQVEERIHVVFSNGEMEKKEDAFVNIMLNEKLPTGENVQFEVSMHCYRGNWKLNDLKLMN